MDNYILDRSHLQFCQPESHEGWLELRRKFVGGSDIAGILGDSPWATKFTIWCEKMGFSAKKDTQSMKKGRELEESILEWVSSELKNKLSDKKVEVFKSPATYIWKNLGANLDGIAVIDGEEFGVEIKTTSSAEAWYEVPVHYWLQCQLYMGVCELDKFYLAAKGPRWSKIYEIERSFSTFEIIKKASKKFMASVKEKNHPPLSYTAIELPYIKLLAEKGILNDNHDPAVVFASLQELKIKRKKIEEDINYLEAVLFACIGEGFESESGFVSIKTREISRLDASRLKEEKPEIYEEYIKKSTYVQIKEERSKC